MLEYLLVIILYVKFFEFPDPAGSSESVKDRGDLLKSASHLRIFKYYENCLIGASCPDDGRDVERPLGTSQIMS